MTYETTEAAHEASAYTRSNACRVWPLGNNRTPDEMSTSLTSRPCKIPQTRMNACFAV